MLSHSGCHGMSTRTGMSFFTRIDSSAGGSILKSVNFAGIDPVIRLVPLRHRLKSHVLILRGLPGKFGLHVAVNTLRRQSLLESSARAADVLYIRTNAYPQADGKRC